MLEKPLYIFLLRLRCLCARPETVEWNDFQILKKRLVRPLEIALLILAIQS